MTERIFERMFNELIGSEGGYSDNPKDAGNWTGGKQGLGVLKGTKYGVSAAAYPNLDIKNLTLADAKYIFRRDYWDKCKCDLLPDCVCVLVADFAYNSGCNRAIKILQKTLGVKTDGIIGNATLCAVNSANKNKLIEDYCDNRLEFLQKTRDWNYYGRGWTARVERMENMAKVLI